MRRLIRVILHKAPGEATTGGLESCTASQLPRDESWGACGARCRQIYRHRSIMIFTFGLRQWRHCAIRALLAVHQGGGLHGNGCWSGSNSTPRPISNRHGSLAFDQGGGLPRDGTAGRLRDKSRGGGGTLEKTYGVASDEVYVPYMQQRSALIPRI